LRQRGPAFDASRTGHGVPLPVRGHLEQLPAAVHPPQRRRQVPRHRGAVHPPQSGRFTAGALYPGDHRIAAVGHPLDRTVSVLAAVLAYRPALRCGQGLTRPRAWHASPLVCPGQEGNNDTVVEDRSTQRRPTINDVAEVSGLSRGTVSRVLTGEGYVSKESRTAVLKAVRTTGYVANRHARGLATQRSHTVAFVLSEPQHRLFEDPNFSILLRECTQALAAHDIMLVLTIAGSEADRKRVGRFVSEGGVDGALLVSDHTGSSLVDELSATGIPLVVCGRPLEHGQDIAYVAADDRDGARRMVHHLREIGREHITTIAGPQDTSVVWNAWRAFMTCWVLWTRTGSPWATTPTKAVNGPCDDSWNAPPTWTRSSSPPT